MLTYLDFSRKMSLVLICYLTFKNNYVLSIQTRIIIFLKKPYLNVHKSQAVERPEMPFNR